MPPQFVLGEVASNIFPVASGLTIAANTLLARDSNTGLITPCVSGGANDTDKPFAISIFDIDTTNGSTDYAVYVSGTFAKEGLIVDSSFTDGVENVIASCRAINIHLQPTFFSKEL